jgi:hypothetical protein
MSRTTLSILTAAILAALSLGMMSLRYYVLGDEVQRPIGPGTWKVTLAIQGTSHAQARVWTTMPFQLERQHVVDDVYRSEEFSHRPPEARHPDRRRIVWTLRHGATPGPFRLRSEFLVTLNLGRTAGTSRDPSGMYGGPKQGEYLGSEAMIETNHESLSEQARELTKHLTGSTSQLDTTQALFHFVEQKIHSDVHFEAEPGRGAAMGISAKTCLEQGAGDAASRCRLLVALLRNRNIPARMVSGVTLNKGPEQQPHYWVEAYVYDHWLSMCPCHRLFGKLPSTYLVFAYGDKPLVAARRVSDLKYAFLVERQGVEAANAEEESTWRKTFKSLSLYQLPTGERRLVEVLLLMPLAALIVCVFRNIIGITSFGTFSPALIGLAFHDLNSLPGILVFISILLIGWLMRRLLDHYHLLQVPRIAMMLTLIMSVLIALIVISNISGAKATSYVSLFPVVILTGMVERFWTLENEDSTYTSFRTLFQTMFMAMVIALILSRPFIVKHLFCYPETLGLVMAGQLLIGRYTGYRLMELIRFRDFIDQPPTGYSHGAV